MIKIKNTRNKYIRLYNPKEEKTTTMSDKFKFYIKASLKLSSPVLMCGSLASHCLSGRQRQGAVELGERMNASLLWQLEMVLTYVTVSRENATITMKCFWVSSFQAVGYF